MGQKWLPTLERKGEGEKERETERGGEREERDIEIKRGGRKIVKSHTSTYVYTSNDMMNLLEAICSNVDFEVKL